MELNSIAFIPDGNRRYAEHYNIPLLYSYRQGTRKAWDVLEWLLKYPKIKTGTFYTLSLENLQRTGLELKILYKLFERQLYKVSSSGFFENNNIKLSFIGRMELLPKSLQQKITETEKFTENFSGTEINLAIGYNGQAEIIDAAKKFAEDYSTKKTTLDSLNEETFKNYLYKNFPNPDLIIRTSGTKRLSGFLAYQSAYSELYFSPKYWPEFSENDLQIAVDDFYERQRRFGK